MPLRDVQIRNPRPAEKPHQCADERGLYLEVQPSGSRLWRYKYRYIDKQKRLALGRYPEVGLEDARRRRDEARRTLGDVTPSLYCSGVVGLEEDLADDQ